MTKKGYRVSIVLACVAAAAPGCTQNQTGEIAGTIRQVEVDPPPGLPADPLVLLGKVLFFDDSLSTPSANERTENLQGCDICHGPAMGWTGPISEINAHGAVYPGAHANRFGPRKPPSSAYATLSPILHVEPVDGESLFVGGNFWDGRATGEELGNPAADQAQRPPLNPVEMANPSIRVFCKRILQSDFDTELTGRTYDDLFAEAFFPGALDCKRDIDGTYDRFALAVEAYEASQEVNAFSSKYDAFLAGEAELTAQERLGLTLFDGKAMCSNCHVLDSDPDGGPPVYTDFTYDNIGVPRNPENPFYDMPPSINPDGEDFIDLGLGGFLLTREDWQGLAQENFGKMKVPTLRNVDKRPREGFVKAYMHNGYFKTLKGVVAFYDTRDVWPTCPGAFTEAEALAAGCWPPPEVPVNVNREELGNLGLREEEEDAIVAFLKTLSDGFRSR